MEAKDVTELVDALDYCYNLLENFLDDFSHQYFTDALPENQLVLFENLCDLRDDILDKTTEIEIAVGILEE